MFAHIGYGFLHVFEWQTLLFIVMGSVFGFVIGALPGISVVVGVAILLPFTFSMSPATGILMLLGVYSTGTWAGSVSAVLLNVPGTPAAAAVTADGFALSRQGKAYEALNYSLHSSTTGALMGSLPLLFLSPLIANVAIHFGPPAFFSLTLFAITVIASVSGETLSKGLLMAAWGMFFSTVGLDPINGQPRFVFNTSFLNGGVGLIPALIGLFSLPEVLNLIEKRAQSIAADRTLKTRGKFAWRNMWPFRWGAIRASIIGIVVGIVPGTGAAIAAFIAYSEAKRASKKPELFGKGSVEGVVACEAANNATTAGTLIPTMTLGIPGDVVSAILLGALLVHGLTPGPRLFVDQAHLVYTILVGFLVCTLVMYGIGKLVIPWVARITIAPSQYLLPAILALSLIGSYAYTNSLLSVGITLIFGIIGYVMRKFDYPLSPMIIGLILGPVTETSLRQSILMSNGNPLIFLERPYSLAFIVLFVLSLFLSALRKRLMPARR